MVWLWRGRAGIWCHCKRFKTNKYRKLATSYPTAHSKDWHQQAESGQANTHSSLRYQQAPSAGKMLLLPCISFCSLLPIDLYYIHIMYKCMLLPQRAGLVQILWFVAKRDLRPLYDWSDSILLCAASKQHSLVNIVYTIVRHLDKSPLH